MQTSRSHRHQAISGITMAESDASDNRIAKHALRRAVEIALSTDPQIIPALREVSGVWNFAKDGKSSFDPIKHSKLMRK